MAIVTKYVLELLAIARSLLFLARCRTAVLPHYDQHTLPACIVEFYNRMKEVENSALWPWFQPLS